MVFFSCPRGIMDYRQFPSFDIHHIPTTNRIQVEEWKSPRVKPPARPDPYRHFTDHKTISIRRGATNTLLATTTSTAAQKHSYRQIRLPSSPFPSITMAPDMNNAQATLTLQEMKRHAQHFVLRPEKHHLVLVQQNVAETHYYSFMVLRFVSPTHWRIQLWYCHPKAVFQRSFLLELLLTHAKQHHVQLIDIKPVENKRYVSGVVNMPALLEKARFHWQKSTDGKLMTWQKELRVAREK